MYMQEGKENIRIKRTNRIKEFFIALWGGEKEANARLLHFIAGMSFGLAAYFFGCCEMPFGTFTLGVALLSSAERYFPYILAGACLSSFKTSIAPAVCIITYLTVTVIRILAKLMFDNKSLKDLVRTERTPSSLAMTVKDIYNDLFTESIYLRLASAAIGAFCLSLYIMIKGDYRYYDLFGLLFSMIVTPAATFFISAHFERSKTDKATIIQDIGTLVLLTAVSYATRNITFFGVYIGAFFAFFVTLYIGRKRGILIGCLTGLCLGLAFKPIYAPLFILEAAAAGVLWNISALAAATAGCVVGIIWGVYVNGFSALSQLLPALLCGAMVFGAADKLSLLTSEPELIKSKTEERSALELMVCDRKNRSGEECIQGLSLMFAELAESFYNLSDRLRRPRSLDLSRMCDTVFEKHCNNCTKREICWGVEYSQTLDTMNLLIHELHTGSRAELVTVPNRLIERCPDMQSIINDINENCALLTEHALMCDRTGVFAMNYDGISQILAEAIEKGREDYIIDDDTASSVSECLKKLRCSSGGVIAFGGRRKSVAVKGLDISRAKINIGDLKGKLEENIKIPLNDPSFTPSQSKGLLDMTVSVKRKFAVKQYHYSVSSKETENGTPICGDTVTCFENSSDYSYSLLSDGMGTGKEAAFISRICTVFLEKMLSANNKCETSVKLLNSFMSERDGSAAGESTATVDLLEVDLLNGNASVLKSGAAPTYLLRNGNCFKYMAKTVPLGILNSPDISRIPFTVEAGDRIIMISDGVTQNREDCVWLVSMLSSGAGDVCMDSGVLAKRIAERARAEGSEDDITACVVDIESI